MGRLEEFEGEVKRIGRELRDAKHRFETYRLESRVQQRQLMVRIVAASSEPMTPADIQRELVHDGFPFLSKDPAHQEASVYQACRDLEQLGEFRRTEGRKLAYRVVPGEVGKQQAWECFVQAWWDKYRSTGMRVRELLDLADHLQLRLGVEGRDEHSRLTDLGIMLQSMRGRLFGNLQITAEPSGKHYRIWVLARKTLTGKVSLKSKAHQCLKRQDRSGS